jgi:tRNA threonylcarbamoyl adenosine modification protein YjeE
LIERYPLEGGDVAHLDLYRISDPDELEYLGLDDLSDEVRLWLIEWPERGAGALPAVDLIVRLSHLGAGRRARIEAPSPTGSDWLARLEAAGLRCGTGRA